MYVQKNRIRKNTYAPIDYTYEIILKRLVKRESDRQGNKLLITEIENCTKLHKTTVKPMFDMPVNES